MASFSLTWTTLVCVLMVIVASDEFVEAAPQDCYVLFYGRSVLDRECMEPDDSVRLAFFLQPLNGTLDMGTWVSTRCLTERPACSRIKTQVSMTKNRGRTTQVDVKWTTEWRFEPGDEQPAVEVTVTPSVGHSNLSNATWDTYVFHKERCFFYRTIDPAFQAAGQSLDLGDGKWSITLAASNFDANDKEIGDTDFGRTRPAVAASGSTQRRAGDKSAAPSDLPRVSAVIAMVAAVVTLVTLF